MYISFFLLVLFICSNLICQSFLTAASVRPESGNESKPINNSNDIQVTDDPSIDVDIKIEPDPVIVNKPLTITTNINNLTTNDVTNVNVVYDFGLTSKLSFLSAISSQGSCIPLIAITEGNENGSSVEFLATVECNLATILSEEAVTIVVGLQPNGLGTRTDTVSISADNFPTVRKDIGFTITKMEKANLKVRFSNDPVESCTGDFSYRVFLDEVNGVWVTVKSYMVDEVSHSAEEFVNNFKDCGELTDGVVNGFTTACFDVTDFNPGIRKWTFFGTDADGNDLEVTGSVSLTKIPIADDAPPHADFKATPTSGGVPLVVEFTDLSESRSIGELNRWFWDFGDGNFSTEINPIHTYTELGIYSVSLTVSAEFEVTVCSSCFFECTSSEIKRDFISVFNRPLEKINVEPKIIRSSIRPQTVIVSAVDPHGNPVCGVKIDALANSQRVFVKPLSSITGPDGTSEFKVRFRFARKDGKVTFSAADLNVTVLQE